MNPTYPLWCANYTAEEAIQEAVAHRIKTSVKLAFVEEILQMAADEYMASIKRMSELSIHLEWTSQREDLERLQRVSRDLKSEFCFMNIVFCSRNLSDDGLYGRNHLLTTIFSRNDPPGEGGVVGRVGKRGHVIVEAGIYLLLHYVNHSALSVPMHPYLLPVCAPSYPRAGLVTDI